MINFFLSYFLNPQFQYGVKHGTDVYQETFEGTNKVIMTLERDVDVQIKAFRQVSKLLIYFGHLNYYYYISM